MSGADVMITQHLWNLEGSGYGAPENSICIITLERNHRTEEVIGAAWRPVRQDELDLISVTATPDGRYLLIDTSKLPYIDDCGYRLSTGSALPGGCPDEWEVLRSVAFRLHSAKADHEAAAARLRQAEYQGYRAARLAVALAGPWAPWVHAAPLIDRNAPNWTPPSSSWVVCYDPAAKAAQERHRAVRRWVDGQDTNPTPPWDRK